MASAPPAASARSALALRGGAVPAALVLAGCLLTALAAHHSSRAQGGVLVVHLLAGALGLLLPLAATAWVLRPSHASARRPEAAALCAVVAAGIAAVELTLLAWLVLTSGLSALG